MKQEYIKPSIIRVNIGTAHIMAASDLKVGGTTYQNLSRESNGSFWGDELDEDF